MFYLMKEADARHNFWYAVSPSKLINSAALFIYIYWSASLFSGVCEMEKSIFCFNIVKTNRTRGLKLRFVIGDKRNLVLGSEMSNPFFPITLSTIEKCFASLVLGWKHWKGCHPLSFLANTAVQFIIAWRHKIIELFLYTGNWR